MTGAAQPDATGSRGRIGIVVSGRHLGSRERLFFAVGEALCERGWQVDLLTAGIEPALRDALHAQLRSLREEHPALYDAEARAELTPETHEALRQLGYLE